MLITLNSIKETDHELNPRGENYFYDQFDATEDTSENGNKNIESATEPSLKITYETPKNWAAIHEADREAKKERLRRRNDPDFDDPGNFHIVKSMDLLKTSKILQIDNRFYKRLL